MNLGLPYFSQTQPPLSVHHGVEEGLVQLLLAVHNGMGQVTKRTGGHKVVLNPDVTKEDIKLLPIASISSIFTCCNLIHEKNMQDSH